MLRCYIYYSVGGYKEMYLGSSKESYEHCYFLPLLPVYKQRLLDKDDGVLRQKVELLEQLPAIGILENQHLFHLPRTALRLFSHGGYKLYYGHLENNTYILALRDIACNDRDETNRSAPFSFAVTCDSAADLPMMEGLTCHIATHLEDASTQIANMIGYDIETNGLKVQFSKLLGWIKQSADKTPHPSIPIGRRSISVTSDPNQGLVVLPAGITPQTAVEELQLQGKKVYYLPIAKIGNSVADKAIDATEAVESIKRTVCAFITTAQQRTGLTGWRFWGLAIIVLWASLKILKWLLL